MPMDTKTKITLVGELLQNPNGIRNRQIARDPCLNHETVGNYIRGIDQKGLLPFLASCRSAPRKPRPSRQVPISVKQKVPEAAAPREVVQIDTFLERYHYHRPHLGLVPLRPPLVRKDQQGKGSDLHQENL